MNRLIIISAILLTSSSAYAAGNEDPASMANSVGFNGCNSLIKSVFDNSVSAKEKRTNIRYYPEQSKDTVDIDMTYGSTGDTVIHSAHFSRRGGYCYASATAMITEPGNCAGLLSQDKYFKYVGDSAGVLWSKNKGGTSKLFTQTGNYCTQIFVTDTKVKI